MITKLQVKNFKCLKDISLALSRRNVLIGPNMSGKSTLVAVFRFLRQMVSGPPGLPNAVNSEGGFLELAWRGGESNLITISLEGDLRATDGNPERKWYYDLELVGDRLRNFIRVQNETLRVSDPCQGYFLIKTDSSGDRQLLASSGSVITHVPDTTRSGLEYEIPDWEGNAFRLLFASFQFYRLIPRNMKQVNVFSAPALLEETGTNLSAWLMLLQLRHKEAFNRILSAMKDVLPNVADLVTWPAEQSRVFIASSEKYLRTPVPVWQMSDGELCFLAFLSLMFAPKEYGAGLFCVEEPENYLHPKLIEALIALHDQRQLELGEDAGQVVVTTHSPLLVDRCRVEDVIVVEKREGATICTRPSDRPRLRELLTREDIGLGDLLYSGALRGEP